MCGIAGFIDFEGDLFGEIHLKSTNDYLKHRGPDGFNILKTNKKGYAHAKLAVQDLTEKSDQPFFDKKTKSVLVFNGEIYNYIELKKELSSLYGTKFENSGDAEVLFKGLLLEGIEFIKKTNGDFSFCFYCGKKKSTYLVRDRIGVKPLYYNLNKKYLLFSSEISAFKAFNVKLEFNNLILNDYLALRYTRGYKTAFKGINRLPPAHWLELTAENAVEIKKYWCPVKDNSFKTKTKTKIELHSLFQDSVNLRMRSKVNVGALLSGGVDSSLIVCASIKSERSLNKTFTCNFISGGKEKKIDALNAVDLSKSLEIKNIIYTHEKEYFEEALKAIEEPIADTIISPLYGLIKQVKGQSKVLLAGEGADEVFAGYAHHYFLSRIFYMPKILRRLIYSYLNFFGCKSLLLFKNLYPLKLGEEELDRIISALGGKFSLEKSYHNICDIYTKEERKRLIGDLSHDLRNETNSIMEEVPGLSPLKKIIYLELKTWLPNYNLLKLDKLTSAHSIEGRVPFLDHRLIEYVFSCSDWEIFSLLSKKPLIYKIAKKFRKIKRRVKYPFTHLNLRADLINSKTFSEDKCSELEKHINVLAFKNIIEGKNRDLLYKKKVQSMYLFLQWLKIKR